MLFGRASRKRRADRSRHGATWRRRSTVLAAGAAAVAVAAGLSAFFVVSHSGGPSGPPKAAIVDQLSLTAPNPDFVERATGLLEQAGYTVDYYPGEQVNVEFYRRLPVFDYDFILFRVHADRLKAVTREGEEFDEVILFTSEPYDKDKYIQDQAANRLVIARYYRGGPGYFGVAPEFIDQRLGDFDGATVVMMGCEGLLTDRTAEAFVQRGAETYISWDETVSASHTDLATERLLEHLVLEDQPPAAAVAQTMDEVGPDPAYGSKLLAYPPEG